MTLVTTARLTRAENCLLNVGEIVESARTDCTTPRTIIPVIGAPNLLTLVKKAGNIRCSAADLPVCPMVNCHPSSDPRQARTANAMMIEPIVGLNIFAYANANGPVDSASSLLGTMPWMTVVERM